MEAFQKLIILIAVTTTISACSKVAFSPDVNIPSTATEAPSQEIPDRPAGPSVVCGPTQQKIIRPTRVLFVVDQSGSNVNGPFEAPGQATDPLKNFRKDVMSQFFQSNLSKGNLSWGLSVFNDVSSENLMTNSSNQVVPFSPVPADFGNALQKFMLRQDIGNTPYRAALGMIKQSIANDLPTAPQYVSYLVAFITDGYPTDYCPGGAAQTTCPGTMLESQIDADVKAITNLAPAGDIHFSTIYYGKPNSDASGRLSRMAALGAGEFVDTNTTLEVKLNDILEVEQEICVEK